MAGVRRALIVATDEYSDPKLTSLKAPADDARILADVLRDDAVGGFGVTTVFNRPSHEVELAIAEFFATGRFGDTLLVHFSCHGVKSASGELYFATTNTDLSDAFKLKVTGVPSALVRDAMEESRASLILCLVDCCYSGAFVKLTKAADTVDLTERLGGRGRAVITASTSLQLALDGEEEPSLFTHAVIDGLRSGEADRDLDGLVSLDELYNFVHERVTSRNPNQTPVKSFDVEGEVYVARRSTPVTRPAPLEPDLLADARALVTYKRLGAVQGLAHVLAEQHPGRSFAARLELERLASDDDSLSVRDQAQKLLDATREPPAPAIPDYQPVLATRGGPVVEDPPVTVDVPDAHAADPETGTETEADAKDGRGGRGHSTTLKRAALVALGLIGVLLVGFTWQALDDDADPRVSETGPVLPDTELLVAVEDPQVGRGIFAVDTGTGNSRLILQDPAAALPTISEDRRWMVYLTTQGGVTGGVPRLARVDGSEDARLLDVEASQDCPFTTRPAFDPDGELLATNCVDSDRNIIGLAIIDRDGHLVRLVRLDDLREAPTWTDDGRIIVVRDVEGDGTTSLWAMSAETEALERLTDGLDGSDSHPDWSDRGLLFLRDREGSSEVVYLESLDTREVSPIVDSGRAQSPTWAPGDDPAVVWLEPAAEGVGRTLWLQALGDASPTELSTAAYGPPAWGSR